MFKSPIQPAERSHRWFSLNLKNNPITAMNVVWPTFSRINLAQRTSRPFAKKRFDSLIQVSSISSKNSNLIIVNCLKSLPVMSRRIGPGTDDSKNHWNWTCCGGYLKLETTIVYSLTASCFTPSWGKARLLRNRLRKNSLTCASWCLQTRKRDS